METFNGCSSCREDGQDAKSYPCSLERTDLPDQSLSVLHQALNSSSSTPFDKGQLFDLSSNGILALDVFEEADWSTAAEKWH
jgi:hypothetical protein